MTHFELINKMLDKLEDARAFHELNTNQSLAISAARYSLLALGEALQEGDPKVALAELDDYFKILGIKED
jgi:hypothetical protein